MIELDISQMKAAVAAAEAWRNASSETLVRAILEAIGVTLIVPPEPPVGTWVRDKLGAVSVRLKTGWAPAPVGYYATGKWSAMWRARGPLVVCEPYGGLKQLGGSRGCRG